MIITHANGVEQHHYGKMKCQKNQVNVSNVFAKNVHIQIYFEITRVLTITAYDSKSIVSNAMQSERYGYSFTTDILFEQNGFGISFCSCEVVRLLAYLRQQPMLCHVT
jgi:hypothetical protein